MGFRVAKDASVHSHNRQFLPLTHICNTKIEDAVEAAPKKLHRSISPTAAQQKQPAKGNAEWRKMEIKRPEDWKREEGFTMLKGGKGYTIADIEALPEGERAELIDGELFWMNTPVRQHQDILAKLFLKIGNYIEENKGKCKIYPAPFAVYIKKDKRNHVEPDISVICDQDKLDEKGCQGAPDWMIEIVSPSSKKMDYERKVKLYREADAREYWIVDAETETVTVYDFEHGKDAVRYTFSERIKAGIFKDLWLNLSEMDFG